MKRFFAFALILCMMMSIASMSAMAAEVPTDRVAEEIDYMNYDFPEDAVILYQGEDGVVYQSKEESIDVNAGIVPYSMEYESVYLTSGRTESGQFSIKNPHTLTTTQGTYKVESGYNEAKARFILTDGLSSLATRDVTPADGDVRFSFKSLSSNLVIKYYVLKASTKYDIRLMCWLW